MKKLVGQPQQSPVEIEMRSGPMGEGNWPGYGHVYDNISKGASAMGADNNAYLSDDHIQTMGDLGSGHEERMKARQMWLRDNGWI